MYKLLVIEDEELIRKGIVSLINYEDLNIQEVFEAENGKKHWILSILKCRI